MQCDSCKYRVEDRCTQLMVRVGEDGRNMSDLICDINKHNDCGHFLRKEPIIEKDILYAYKNPDDSVALFTPQEKQYVYRSTGPLGSFGMSPNDVWYGGMIIPDTSASHIFFRLTPESSPAKIIIETPVYD